jgi:hypothetical protein
MLLSAAFVEHGKKRNCSIPHQAGTILNILENQQGEPYDA